MKVHRSKKHEDYMHGLAQRINARRGELMAAGVSSEMASKQANDEIVMPELKRRAESRERQKPEYDGRFEREREEEREANAKFRTPLEQAYGDSDDPTIP